LDVMMGRNMMISSMVLPAVKSLQPLQPSQLPLRRHFEKQCREEQETFGLTTA
jgi:hypothetical protein